MARSGGPLRQPTTWRTQAMAAPSDMIATSPLREARARAKRGALDDARVARLVASNRGSRAREREQRPAEHAREAAG